MSKPAACASESIRSTSPRTAGSNADVDVLPTCADSGNAAGGVDFTRRSASSHDSPARRTETNPIRYEFTMQDGHVLRRVSYLSTPSCD